MLVAVAPDLRGHWIWQDLVGAVNEALDLSKIGPSGPTRSWGEDPVDPASSGTYFQVLTATIAELTAGSLAAVAIAAIVCSGLAQRQP